MEPLFRKYFWTIELAFLGLAAFLSAWTTNAYLGSKLAGGLAVSDSSHPRAAAPQVVGMPARLDLEKTAGLLGITLPNEEERRKEEELAPAYDPNAEPVLSSLRATLIGTMVANRPEWSFATLRDDSSSEARLYLVGDTFLGAEILEIERLRVILLNEGRKEYLSVDGPAGPPQRAPSMPVTTAPPRGGAPAVAEADVRRVGENQFEISREDVERQLSNLNTIATQARIVPSFKNGEANGFKVFSIRPGSIYQKLGIQNGDVIKKINGYEINSPDKALEVYAKLKESSKIEVELERRGKTENSTVNVK